MIRFVLAATSLIVGLLVLPYALVPVFNSADVIVAAAPIVAVIFYLAPSQADLVEEIRPDHPDALGSLDLHEREALTRTAHDGD